MKQFFPKNRVCVRAVAGGLALVLFFLSACQNFVIPTMTRQTNNSTAKLTELKAEWWNEGVVSPSAGMFTANLPNSAKTDMFTLSGFNEDVSKVTFTFKVNDPNAEVVYDMVDRVLFDRSAQMTAYTDGTGVGKIEFDMTYRFDTDVYIYVGRYTYTMRIQKSVTNNRLYVSPNGNRSGNDTSGGELRGNTPGTAFYSLKNAIARGMLTGCYTIFIMGELKDDPQETSADATFVIANVDKRLRIWSYNNVGKLAGKPGKRVLNIIDSDVTFINLGIEGGIAENGGGAYIESSRAAFLNCTIKDNTAKTGGALYLADQKTGRWPATATFSGGTKMQWNTANSSSAGIWAGENSKLVFENAEIDDSVRVEGMLSVPSSSTAKLGNVLVAGSGSAAIEGTLNMSGTLTHSSSGKIELSGTIGGSGDTVITDASTGAFTVKGSGHFTSSGKIKLAKDKMLTLSGTLANSSTTGIEPQMWTIGNQVLALTDGAGATDAGKFSMPTEEPRHMWKVDDEGKLAHSATETITFSEVGTNKKSTISGSFYLGADYITVKDVDIADTTTGSDPKTVFIYAEPENGLQNITQDEINIRAKAVFSFSTTAPAAVDAAKNGRYDATNKKRAIGVFYKPTATEYLLELDMVTGTMSTPSYQTITPSSDIEFHATVNPSTGKPSIDNSSDYAYTDASGNDYSDAYYTVELAGAVGGNGGYGGDVDHDGAGRTDGESGAVYSVSLRGISGTGITYGLGGKGSPGGNATYPSYGGGGGGGGGGDTWVKGAGGYYIATGGDGGRGQNDDSVPHYGFGGGGGGSFNQLGGASGGDGGSSGSSVGGGGGGRDLSGTRTLPQKAEPFLGRHSADEVWSNNGAGYLKIKKVITYTRP